MADAQALHLNQDNFQTTLDEAGEKPVFIDFYADWCGPCQMAAPIVEELAGEYADKAVIAKVNVDENQALAQQYQVVSIPTVVIIKKGEPVDRMTGFAGKDGFTKLLDKALEA